MNSQKYQNILYFVLFSALLACNKEYFSVGAELYNPQFEDLESVVFPVPDKPKKIAVCPSLPILAEQCIGSTPRAGSI